MTVFTIVFLGNPIQSWLIAVAIAAGTFGVLVLARRIFLHRLVRFAKTTKTELDDVVAEVLEHTRWALLLIVSLYLGLKVLVLGPVLQRLISIALFLAILLQVTLWASAAVSYVLQRMVRQRMEDGVASATAISLMGFVVKTALWSVCILLALDNLGVNVTGLMAGLGIGGIAVALALQNILGDLVASLSIVLDKPFVIGDFLVVGDHLGTVEYIGIKTTRIRSLSGEQIIFPNGELLKTQIRNFKRMTERRVLFSIGVTYQTPQEKLASIPAMVRGIIESQGSVRFDRAHFKEFGDSALVFEIVYYLLDPDYNIYMDTQQAINLELFRQFEEEGISFAYPTRTLILSQESRGLVSQVS